MEPVSWRSGFAPPATPFTRRLLVYFDSGAYNAWLLIEKRPQERSLLEEFQRMQIPPQGSPTSGLSLRHRYHAGIRFLTSEYFH
jgi:hypothetical protein